MDKVGLEPSYNILNQISCSGNFRNSLILPAAFVASDFLEISHISMLTIIVNDKAKNIRLRLSISLLQISIPPKPVSWFVNLRKRSAEPYVDCLRRFPQRHPVCNCHGRLYILFSPNYCCYYSPREVTKNLQIKPSEDSDFSLKVPSSSIFAIT